MPLSTGRTRAGAGQPPPQNQPKPLSTGRSRIANPQLPATGSGNFQLPPPQDPSAVILPDAPLPAMQTAEGVYAPNDHTLWGATGFMGWARNAFAKVTAGFSEGLSEEEKIKSAEITTDLTQKYSNSSFFTKIIEPLTGITAQEAAAALAPLQAETDTGDKFHQRLTANIGGVKVIGGTLFGIVTGTFAKMSSTATSVSISLDQMLQDEKAIKEHENIDITSLGALMPQTNAKQVTQIIGGLVTGKVSFDEIGQATIRGVASANAIYSLAYDNNLRAEWYRRYKAGENASILNKEAEEKHPWVEAAGDILLDPSTYFGLSVIKPVSAAVDGARYMNFLGKEVKFMGKNWKTVMEIPQFGEMIGLNVGKVRLAREAATINEAVPEVKAALMAAKNIKTDLHALEVVDAVRRADTAQTMLAKANNFKTLAWDAAGKQNILVRDVMHVVTSVFAAEMPTEQKMELLWAMASRSRGVDVERSFTTFLHSPMPDMFFSEKGYQASEILGRMMDENTLSKVLENGIDKQKFIDHIQGIAHDLYPSIDEMEDAYKATHKGGAFAEEAAKNMSPGRQDALTKAYTELLNNKPHIAYGRKILRKTVDPVFNLVRGYMGNVFIALAPAFHVKNITGQFPQLAMRVGLRNAIEISGKALLKPLRGEAKVAEVLAEQAARAEKLFGAVPFRLHSGIGGDIKKSVGISKLGQWAEEITSAEIQIHAGKQIIQAAIDAGALPKATDFIQKGMGETEAALLLKHIQDNFGNTKKGLDGFLTEVGKGTAEKWRSIQPSRSLSSFLERTRPDVLDRLTELQKTAGSQAEFLDGADALLVEMKDWAIKGIQETEGKISGVSMDAPEVFKDIIVQMAKGEGQYTPEEQRVFTSVINAWQAVEGDKYGGYVKMHNDIMAEIGGVDIELVVAGQKRAGKATELMTEIELAANEMYGAKDGLLEMTEKAVQNLRSGKTPNEVWDTLRINKSSYSFDIKDVFPEVSPNGLEPREVINHIWKAYFGEKARLYREANKLKASGLLEVARAAANSRSIQQGVQPSLTAVEELMQKVYKPDVFNGAIDLQKRIDLAEQWENYRYLGDMRSGKQTWSAAKTLDAYGIPTATEKGVPINTGLEIIKKFSGQEFAKLEDVPSNVALDALDKWAKEKGKVARAAPLPAFISGSQPSIARITHESMDTFEPEFLTHVQNIADDWGNVVKVKAGLTPELKRGLQPLLDEAAKNMNAVRGKAMVYGEAMRDFVLHDYNKTNLDHAFAYLSPFHYWQGRTYMRGLETLLENPRVFHAADVLFNTQATIHKDMPEFYRYNLQLKGLPGMGEDDIYMLNLRNAFDPYNGLTGTDFNDPYKRTDWFTRTVDDLGKFGFSPLPLLNWAVALREYKKGDAESGDRWLGRLLPQTQTLKAGLAALNINAPNHGEYDPFVGLVMGGLDPYERRKVGSAGAQMIMNGLDPAEALDAIQYQDSPLWDEMVQKSLQNSATGRITSFFLGVGFKPRTAMDMEVEQFYQEYIKMVSVRDNMSPEQYRMAWDGLRGKYAFADTVLLARRSGPDRDSSYAYNVLGRMPPGSSSNLMELAGVTPDMIQRFYDSKGDTSTWHPGDRDTFMGAVERIGAMLALPNTAVREEWTASRNMYLEMQKRVGFMDTDGEKTELGKQYQVYLELSTDDKKKYLTLNPKLEKAMQDKTAFIANNPLLNTYYGGIETIEQYFDAQARSAMIAKYGKNIYDVAGEYWALKETIFDQKVLTKAQKAFKAAHPQLDGFLKDSYSYSDAVNKEVARMASKLPAAKLPEFRKDAPVSTDKLKAELLAPARGVTPEELVQQMSPELQQIVGLYAQGQELPYLARTQLQRLADSYQMTVDELLQLLLQPQQ